MLNFKGKVAFVAGCGSSGPTNSGTSWGNGKATAVLLARQGATVFGIDRNLAAAEETQAIITQEGGTCHVAAGDALNEADVLFLVELCVYKFGRIDVLINVVGQSEPGGPVEMTTETFTQQLALNTTTAFIACKHVIPIMERQGGGAIVSISSVAGLRYVGKPQVGYAAAKAALMQLTRTAAVIYASKNVRLNCVVPGLMHTPLVDRLAEKYAGGDYDGFVAKRHAQVPMGRMGDAWDVANAAVFLASDEAKYITGTELVVDGGLVASTG
jgi:NAD(P)-dependent dehydrogenase (short-subunit alcohol dehydrogenase family)